MNSVFNFDNIAHEYDNWYKTPAGKKIDEIEKNLFFKYLSKTPYKHIIEIGAGTGHWTKFMSAKGYCITGCDISYKMLKIAANKNISNAVFLNCDATTLPFPDNSANTVVAITSIEFVKNRKKALKEIKRILKVGGYFIIGTLNRKGSLSVIRKNIPTFKDANLFTYKELVSELMDFGFPVVEGCLLIPNPLETDPVLIENADKKTDPRELNEKGNFLVGFVKKEKI